MWNRLFSKTEPEDFWSWLAANTERLKRELRDHPQRAGEEISRHFDRQYPGLTWEGGAREDGPWTFCVSADGNPDLFPRVIETVKGAPEVPGWQIHAFRERGSTDVTIQMGGRSLDCGDIWCEPEPAGDRINLTLWVKGYSSQAEELGSAAVILLDNAIGEYDSVMRIHELQVGSLPPEPVRSEGFFPLPELPAYLDRLFPPN